MNPEDRENQSPPAEPARAPTPGGLPRSVVLLAVAVVALAVVSILFSLGRSDDGDALIDDDFSEASDHWNLDSQSGITSTISDGAYRVSLDGNDLGWLDSVIFDDSIEYNEVLIESTVTFDNVADGANVGLACVSNPGDGESVTGLFGRYEARIDVEGHALVERFLNDDTVTVEEVESPVELDESGENDLALNCRLEDDTAFVTLTLNDEEVISVENENTALAGYEGAGMVANAVGSGLEVAFDNLTARSVE
jgi:hypothetical protein